MISIAITQAINNSAAIFLCQKLLQHENSKKIYTLLTDLYRIELDFSTGDCHSRDITEEPNDGEETSTSLLKKQENPSGI